MVPYPVGHRKRDGFIANYETACVERERFFSRTNWTAAVAEASASEALGPEDRAMTLRYDQSEHPLLDAFCDLVGERHLATVHNRWPAHDRARSHLEEKRALLAPLTVPSAKRDAFEETYDRLVREVVLPAIAKRRRRARAACHANDDERYPYAAFPRARAAAVFVPRRRMPRRLHVRPRPVLDELLAAAREAGCARSQLPARRVRAR